MSSDDDHPTLVVCVRCKRTTHHASTRDDPEHVGRRRCARSTAIACARLEQERATHADAFRIFREHARDCIPPDA